MNDWGLNRKPEGIKADMRAWINWIWSDDTDTETQWTETTGISGRYRITENWDLGLETEKMCEVSFEKYFP